MQLVGEADNIISEYSLLNGETIYIDIQRDDEVPLISAISIIVDGGTDEMLMHSFNYHNASSNKPCNDNPSVGGVVGGGSFSTLWLIILFGTLVIYKIIAVEKKGVYPQISK